MSRPLTCDGCNKIIEESIAPIKVAVAGPPPKEYEDLNPSELSQVLDTLRQAGIQIVPQQQLDFCGYSCLATYATAQWGSALLTESEC